MFLIDCCYMYIYIGLAIVINSKVFVEGTHIFIANATWWSERGVYLILLLIIKFVEGTCS